MTCTRKAAWRGLAGMVVAVGMMLCAARAHATLMSATEVKWTLVNFSFCDSCGGTATGYFDVLYAGDGSKTVGDYSITVDDQQHDITFTPGEPGSSVTITGDPVFDVLQNDPLEFNFTVDTLDPNSIATVSAGFFTDNNGFTCDLTGGTLDPSPVPEPASLALAASGMLLLLGTSWRRRVLAR
ncbi:MAG: PEP-CTERM sorting domain-containing protein [Terriglobales bacterium]